MAVNIKKIGSEELEKQKKYCQKVSSLLEKRYKNQDKPLACVVTYGCQQNVADSEHIKGMLEEMGYGFTEDRTQAKLVIFNTCAVREHAEDRVFGNVGALKKYKLQNPDVVIALCGCMMQQKHIAEIQFLLSVWHKIQSNVHIPDSTELSDWFARSHDYRLYMPL